MVRALLILVLSIMGSAAHAACPSSCPVPAAWGQPFTFAGLTWERKSGCGGPGPNCWAPANAEVAADGVHMRLTRVSGRWYAGEIRTVQPVGYGTYSVRLIGRTDQLDPNVVLGIFLYDDEGAEAGEPCPAELDMESSRFGDPLAPNGHGVVYASGQCGTADLYDFDYGLNGDYTTHQLGWEPGVASLRWLHGHLCTPQWPEQVIAQRTFASPLVPVAGRMRLHINLWAFAGNAPTDHQNVEVVLHDIVTTCGATAAAEPPSADLAPMLAVRPNPVQGETEVWFTGAAGERVTVTVVDVAGRHVTTLAEGVSTGTQRVRWSARGRDAGVYFVRMTAGARIITRRVVVLD
jgi:hypothetical protein